MITTDINSNDTIVRFDQIEQNEEKKANASTGQSPPGEQYTYEIEDQNNKAQLEHILAEQQEKEVLEQQERQRLERIKMQQNLQNQTSYNNKKTTFYNQ